MPLFGEKCSVCKGKMTASKGSRTKGGFGKFICHECRSRLAAEDRAAKAAKKAHRPD